MEQFDVIVIGSGSGMLIASAAVEQGFKVAGFQSFKVPGQCHRCRHAQWPGALKR